jgi:uncharacterized membrane protein
VVGDAEDASGTVSAAFKWTSATGMVALPAAGGGADSIAYAISAFGIVGGGLSLPEAFLWAGGLEYDLNTYVNGQRAYGISNNGVMVGVGYDASDHWKAVRWTTSYAQPVALDTTGSYSSSVANGISADGTTIVGNTSSGAFKWTSSSGIALLSGGASTTANAASANGGVIVGSISGAPVLWSGSNRTLLGAGTGEAFAVSGDGSVVVGTTAGNAFIWDSSSGQRRLLADVLTAAGVDLTGTGWNLNQGTGISSTGKVIVGLGSHNGYDQGWIARLP